MSIPTDSTNTPSYTAEQVAIIDLQAQLAALQAQVTAPRSTTKEPKVNDPSPFSTRKDDYDEFILKCETVFRLKSITYALDETKVGYTTNLLKGEAYAWYKSFATLDLTAQPEWLFDWHLFKAQFKARFAETDIVETSRQKLKSLHQAGPASTYATEFQRLTAHLNWGDEPLRQVYFDGLRDDVKDKILTPALSSNVKSIYDLIDLSITWDNLLFQRRRSHSTTAATRLTPNANLVVNKSRPVTFQAVSKPAPTSTSSYTPTPMEIDGVRPVFKPLTDSEKAYRKQNNLCSYCGGKGHFANVCPKRPQPHLQPRTKINANTALINKSENSQPQA